MWVALGLLKLLGRCLYEWLSDNGLWRLGNLWRYKVFFMGGFGSFLFESPEQRGMVVS